MPKNRTVLIKPLITEKSMIRQNDGIYTFLIDTLCNKLEVKSAVEKMFKVTVKDVRTIKIYPKKKRTRKGYFKTTKVMKKAVVVLHDGQTIESLNIK
jgi:large subunit ribosomal protein L23